MRIAIVLFIVLIIAVIFEWIREIHTFQVTHYDIVSPKLRNLSEKKVILLSDLHNCSYGKDNQRLLDAIHKEKPDMILVSGDVIIGKKGESIETGCSFMEQLPKICDTYFANGNHEQRMKEHPEIYGNAYEEFRERVISSGVHYLENRKELFTWESREIAVYGVEIPEYGYQKFCKVSLHDGVMESCLGRCDRNQYNILIAHNPLFASDYKKWGADLIVSGHLHGGVARIPFWRGVITPQYGLFPKYSGELTQEGDTSIVVSKGIGIHTIKVRFLNPAEVVVLHIGGSEE